MLLYDEFTGSTLNTAIWVANKGSGTTITQSGGNLNITVPAAVDAWVDLYSKQAFPVGTTFEARVYVSGGQWYDHKGIGFADKKIKYDCGLNQTEAEAAMWRGQDEANETETAITGQSCYTQSLGNYSAKWMKLKVVRKSNTQVDFTVDGAVRTHTAYISSWSLPVRFSVMTYSSAPSNSISIKIDWVKVTQP